MTNKPQMDWSFVQTQTPDWFADAKFGLFFHWGPYSVPAFQNEWYSRNMYGKGLEQNIYHEKTYGPVSEFGYKDFYDMMDGSKFNAEEWADLVVRSGAKYAGPVSEHADNFSMWDSKINPINCVNYGPKQDITRLCADAFRRRGIKVLSTFHHQWLWGWFMSSDPDADVYLPENEKYYGPSLPLETNRYLPYRYPDKAFCNSWRDKIIEVIDAYQPEALYFDSRTCIIAEETRLEIADYYYHKSGIKDGILTYKQEDFPEGIGVFDIECGRFSEPKSYVWQSDDRLEDNITWCMVQEPKYKSSRHIIHQLCDIVSKNGNLLLNVGPYADGSFHPDAVKELYKVGDWLKINGEAIYETRPWSIAAEGPTTVHDDNYDVSKIEEQLQTGDAIDVHSSLLSSQDFRFTTKGDTLYAITFGWPNTGTWKINSLGLGTKAISQVSLIGHASPLVFSQNEDALYIQAPNQTLTSEAFVLKMSPMQ